MSLMLAQMGLSVVQSASQYGMSKLQSSMNKSIQDYRNTMASLSAAQATNTVTHNEIAVQDASMRTAEQQQLIALQQESTADVSSAAAGVSGNTSNIIVRNLKANAARANKSRLDQLQAQFVAYGQERKNIEINRITGQDNTVIPRPSAASALLGLGTNLLSIYDTHQPPSSTLAAGLSGTNGVKIRK